MATITDIAEKAGVSYATVSRALGNSPLVNAVTKERIKHIAQEMGYHVNYVARSLVTNSTCTLGLIVPEVVNPYYPKLIHFLVEEARSIGYTILLNMSGADQQDEALCLQSMYERRTDGIILVTGTQGIAAKNTLQRRHQFEIPLVLLGWVEDAAEVDMVMANDAAGAYDLTRHLLKLGHTRIVLVGCKAYRGPYDRIQGFQTALSEAGLPLNESLYLGVQTQEDLAQTLDTLLQHPNPPTALFAYQDTLAIEMIKHFRQRGISIPQDVAIVGFDNLDIAQHVYPTLTSVDYSIEATAKHTISLLRHRIQCPQMPPQHVILPPTIVVRESCGGDASTSLSSSLIPQYSSHTRFNSDSLGTINPEETLLKHVHERSVSE